MDLLKFIWNSWLLKTVYIYETYLHQNNINITCINIYLHKRLLSYEEMIINFHAAGSSIEWNMDFFFSKPSNLEYLVYELLFYKTIICYVSVYFNFRIIVRACL